MELNHGPFGLQPKALPLSYNTKYFSKRKKDPDLSDTGNRTRGDWVRARHVTYYTISDTKMKSFRCSALNKTLRENFTTKLQGLMKPAGPCRESNAGLSQFQNSLDTFLRFQGLESAGIDPATCRMRIDRSTT